MAKTTRPPKPGRKKTSFTLSPEGLRLLSLLSAHLGISMSAILETLIRDKAKAEQIK